MCGDYGMGAFAAYGQRCSLPVSCAGRKRVLVGTVTNRQIDAQLRVCDRGHDIAGRYDELLGVFRYGFGLPCRFGLEVIAAGEPFIVPARVGFRLRDDCERRIVHGARIRTRVEHLFDIVGGAQGERKANEQGRGQQHCRSRKPAYA